MKQKRKIANSVVVNIKTIVSKINRKIKEKKIRLYRKNYLYVNIDEVQLQKIYMPNWPFYLKLILIPAIILGVGMLMIELYCSNSGYINSIVVGVLGGHLASVIVTWLSDVNTCKNKTMERMRFQHVYFSNLREICSGFIYFYVLFLAENFADKCKKEQEGSKENYKYFKGHPWQYWCSMLNDLLQQKYPFDIVIDGETSEDWITENPSLYDGVEYNIVKKYIEKESKTFIATFFNESDFLERAISVVSSYRNSLPDVYVNDYIYKSQMDIVNKLLRSIEEYVTCVKEKKYIEFWNANHNILHMVNSLTKELYPFCSLRETEHIYHIEYYKSGNIHVRFEELDDYIDDSEDAIYGYIRRNEFRKIKKQKTYNKIFEKENKFSLDNGWRKKCGYRLNR